MRFEWTVGPEGNIVHVARHRLVPAQAEAAVRDVYRVPLPGRQVKGEERGALLGVAQGGPSGPLVLVVVYTVRAGAVRVDTAMRARPRHVREYRAARAAREAQEEQTDD
jgi:hypothetical protein